jgi:hypothetical protein
MTRGPTPVVAGKTTVRRDALAHIAQAVKPAQPAVRRRLDLRRTGGSARRRVPATTSACAAH